MKVLETEIPGIKIIEPDVFGDIRGFFMESWNRLRYREAGIDVDFLQDNISMSEKGVLRGLHFQYPSSQGKLVYVLRGKIFDAAVDVRSGSPTFGKWLGFDLSEENKKQLYLPPGFAHGFYAASAVAMVAYKCTELYAPHNEVSIAWDDPDIGIKWPVSGEPDLSEKDRSGVMLRDIPESELPKFEGV